MITWHFLNRVSYIRARPRCSTESEFTLVSVAWINWDYYYFFLGWGQLVHRRVNPSSLPLVPLYIPRWRETMWCNVSCLRKQRHTLQRSALQPQTLRSFDQRKKVLGTRLATIPATTLETVCWSSLLHRLFNTRMPPYDQHWMGERDVSRNCDHNTTPLPLFFFTRVTRFKPQSKDTGVNH